MILSTTLLVLLWAVVGVRVPTLWRDRRQRALWACIFTLALVKTATFAPVAAVLDTPILPNLLAVVAAFFLLRFIALVTGGRNSRLPVTLTAAVLVALGLLAGVSGGIGTKAEVLAGDLAPAVIAYWVVLETYLGMVLMAATVLFWTVAQDAPAGAPRLGLRTMAAGTCLIAAYAAFKTTLIVAHGLGVPVDFTRIEPVARVAPALGALLGVAGVLVPAIRRARAAAAAYRSLLVLRPLWKAMRDAFPEMILFSPRRAVLELAGVDDVHLRLYRRVIEIRDGMLALRDHLPATLPAQADPAVTEAHGIIVAQRLRAAGEPPLDAPGAWAPVGPEMADEVAWLRRVSRAYRRRRGAALTAPPVRTPRPSGSAR